MGDALIKQVSPKSGSNTLVAAYWGDRAATTYAIPTTKARYSYDTNYFSYTGGVFTALQSFNAVIQVIGKGNYNSSGTAIYAQYRLYQNSTIIATAQIANGTGGNQASLNVSISEGDALSIQLRSINSNGTTVSTNTSAGFYVEVA